MKSFLLICIASLLFVTASAFENGGKQKFERDRFVLAEHGQAIEFIATQNLLNPVVNYIVAQPIQTSTQFIFIKQSPANYSQNLLKHRDVGWQVQKADSKYLKEPLASIKVNEPYRNYLHVYLYE